MQHVIMMDLFHCESCFMPNNPGIDCFSCALKNFRYFRQNNTNIINIHNQLLLKVYSFNRTNKKGLVICSINKIFHCTLNCFTSIINERDLCYFVYAMYFGYQIYKYIYMCIILQLTNVLLLLSFLQCMK